MDIFDKYIFEELVSEYNKPNLSNDDYEELYIRFCNLNHLEEAKPYLLVMRFLGLGIPAEPNAVLDELKSLMKDSIELTGLFYDLKLCNDPRNSSAIVELRRVVEDGYKDKYLKDKSNVTRVEQSPQSSNNKQASANNNTITDDKIHFKKMYFEGCGYSGLYFTSGDIDYLNAKVFIEPVKTHRKVSVRSQIYAGDEPFSKVFSNEYNLKPGDTWFTTTGWGNTTFNCYGDRVYQWRIEIDGKDIYSQDFRFYGGKIDKSSFPLNDLSLFASKTSGALEQDKSKTAVTFDSNTLECLYFKMSFNIPGQPKNIQVFIKVDYMEDGTQVYNKYTLFQLESRTNSCWTGVSMTNNTKWKKGLYKYSVRIGTSSYEGTFTVY